MPQTGAFGAPDTATRSGWNTAPFLMDFSLASILHQGLDGRSRQRLKGGDTVSQALPGSLQRLPHAKTFVTASSGTHNHPKAENRRAFGTSVQKFYLLVFERHRLFIGFHRDL